MLDVDGIEADNGCVEADVRFGEVRGREEVGSAGGREVGFDFVEGGEEGGYGTGIGFFGAVDRFVSDTS